MVRSRARVQIAEGVDVAAGAQLAEDLGGGGVHGGVAGVRAVPDVGRVALVDVAALVAGRAALALDARAPIEDHQAVDVDRAFDRELLLFPVERLQGFHPLDIGVHLGFQSPENLYHSLVEVDGVLGDPDVQNGAFPLPRPGEIGFLRLVDLLSLGVGDHREGEVARVLVDLPELAVAGLGGRREALFRLIGDAPELGRISPEALLGLVQKRPRHPVPAAGIVDALGEKRSERPLFRRNQPFEILLELEQILAQIRPLLAERIGVGVGVGEAHLMLRLPRLQELRDPPVARIRRVVLRVDAVPRSPVRRRGPALPSRCS